MDCQNDKQRAIFSAIREIEWMEECHGQDDGTGAKKFAASATAILDSLGYAHAGKSWDLIMKELHEWHRMAGKK